MSHIFYWSPEANTQPSKLGGSDHYLRLGEYLPSQEPAEADYSKQGIEQGIFFYTSGKYSLKATKALYMEVDGPVTREVKTGGIDYTNEDGNLWITVTAGAVKINAESDIEIAAQQETSDDATTITVDAGKKDVYYIQGKYEKTIDYYEEKIIEAHNHKTNIGVLINTHAGAGVTTSLTCEMTYSTFSVGTTVAEVGVKGLAMSFGGLKNSLTMFTSVTFSFIEGKKVFVDEEFCVVKNETRVFRFTKGITQALIDESCVRSLLASGMDEAAVIAHFKDYDIVI